MYQSEVPIFAADGSVTYGSIRNFDARGILEKHGIGRHYLEGVVVLAAAQQHVLPAPQAA